MPDRTGIFLGWSANLSNFLGLGVEAGASPMYPQKIRVLPLGFSLSGDSMKNCHILGIFRLSCAFYYEKVHVKTSWEDTSP